LLFHLCMLRSEAPGEFSPGLVECVAGDALIGFPILLLRA
jgi:hypothetical protein